MSSPIYAIAAELPVATCVQILMLAVAWAVILGRFFDSQSAPPAAPSQAPTPIASPPAVEKAAAVQRPAAVALPPLDSSEECDVEAGKLVFRPYRNDSGINRGVAVQLVRASSEHVWQTVLDFERYPIMVDDVCAARVYERSPDGDIKVAVSIGYGPVRFTTCLHHKYAPELSQLTWALDASAPASFKHNEGFWVVRPHGPSSCVVYYSIAVEVNGWVPSWVNGFVAKAGLPRAVAWLKKHAERRQLAAPSSATPPPPATPRSRTPAPAQVAAPPISSVLEKLLRCFSPALLCSGPRERRDVRRE